MDTAAGTGSSKRGHLVRAWRLRLEGALAEAAVPPARKLDVPPVVDRLGLFHTGADCPASSLAPDPDRIDADGRFIEATFTAAREVALVALREGVVGMAPREMVDGALADPGSLRSGVASWVSELDHAGTAALRAAAVSWMTDARALAARRSEPDWQAPRLLAHRPAASGVTLTAAVDAVQRSVSGAHLMTLRSSATANDRRVAARIALLWVLVRAELPVSVVLGMRNTLDRLRVDADEDLLESALTDATIDIARARRPSSAPRRPGPWCRWCSLAADCPPGGRWSDRHPMHPLG